MDRCAVLVDAGYLLGAAGTLLGQTDRAGLQVDHAALIQGLLDLAREQTGLPVLRLLWYDGAHDLKPTPEHRTLRVLPDVKLRLGELVQRGGRTVQKGVDSFLQRDLTTLARHHSVADVVLIGGDEDLRRALEEAQDYGVRVHLWGVEAAAPEYNQSQSLIAEADRRWVIPGDWVKRFVLTSKDPAIDSPVQVPTTPAQPTLAQADAAQTQVTATPADLARLKAAYDKSNGSPPLVTENPHERDLVPRLREITSARQQWLDNEADATAETGDPTKIGERFGTRWAQRATTEQLDFLFHNKPILPRHLDGDVLRYAERLGVETWEDEMAKHAVRAGFWDGASTVRGSQQATSE